MQGFWFPTIETVSSDPIGSERDLLEESEVAHRTDWKAGKLASEKPAKSLLSIGTDQLDHFCWFCCYWKNTSTVLGSGFLQIEQALRC